MFRIQNISIIIQKLMKHLNHLNHLNNLKSFQWLDNFDHCYPNRKMNQNQPKCWKYPKAASLNLWAFISGRKMAENWYFSSAQGQWFWVNTILIDIISGPYTLILTTFLCIPINLAPCTDVQFCSFLRFSFHLYNIN